MSIEDEGAGGGPGFERTPPSNIEAEQSVLGGMLLSKDAIADVVEILRSDDFYRPAHQMVYDVITDLYGRGEPADAVTVFDELQKRGEMARVGGAAYLHTLTAVVPTAANAGYYAKIVREQAILRRLIEAGTRIVSFGYGGQNEEVDDLVDRAQAEIYKVTERRTSEDYAPLADIMPGALDELEAIGSRGGQMVGVPTGFQDLDSLTNGLHPGQMIVVAARPAIGKALALDTPLPTPTGWTTMGEVEVGDRLIGADGRPTRVVAATEVMHGRPCYEVEFSDGTVIVADALHQWRTTTRAAGQAGGSSRVPALAGGPIRGDRARHLPFTAMGPRETVLTTEEIAASLRRPAAGDRPKHAVAVAASFDLAAKDLPVPPYALGLWLGGADSATGRFSTADAEIAANLAAEGVRVTQAGSAISYRPALPGPVHGGHIPVAYLRASERQRRDLLAGLLDTAGSVGDGGQIRLAVAGRRLAHDALELILSLGHQATMGPEQAKGRHTIDFTATERLFRLSRKASRQVVTARPMARVRHIVDVRPIPSRPVRCVQVDNADHLYLASRACIPTHNSTLGLDFARSAAIKNGMTTVIFSLEMSRNEITMRLLSAEARVALHAMRSGMMGDDDWTRLARRMSEVAEAPLFIDDSPNMSMMEIRAKCRRLKQRNDLRFVVIDYLQLMSSPKKTESRQNEVSEISRAIKLLAKELEVPVIAISQLNRGPEQRTDKRPAVSDLRESGCLTADTRVLRADTGAETSLGELLEAGARDIPVWSLDENLRLVRRTMTHVFPSGTKEVFRLRLTSGREIKATAGHPFMTYDGWRSLGEIGAGTRLAVPRHVPAPQGLREWPEEEVILLGHMIGAGSFVKGQPIRCTHGEPNPIAQWPDDLGLFGLSGHERFVPQEVFSLPKKQLALFLRHLWASGGCVRWAENPGRPQVHYTSTSRRLIDDVARLLLRFNVMTRVETTRKGDHRPAYRLHAHDAENQLRFLDEVGAHGEGATHAARCAQELRAVTGDSHLDTVPREIWARVRDVLAEQRMPRQAARFPDSAPREHAPGRERLGRVAAVLDDAQMEMLATNDVFWDEVASIERLGEQPVYDATVLGTHNFVANGISVHNSIEQDADMVILLHREDAYERESPRAGEADLIVAKHRNGPTATVTVAFQGHYSRFVDMAQH
ncbi:replicative DNA helicase [Nonomuraea sp. NPDC050643]|uniref:replicative DNA helicase n=1 Tax=Nonomuraea sp. NPDC050643 TaxID=3155660 RepID=UPI0033FB4869